MLQGRKTKTVLDGTAMRVRHMHAPAVRRPQCGLCTTSARPPPARPPCPALAHTRAHAHPAPPPLTGVQDIHVPGVRAVADYESANQAAMAVHGPQIAGDIGAAPYVRQQLPGLYMDEAQQAAEYDAESDDEAFLAKANGQVGGRVSPCGEAEGIDVCLGVAGTCRASQAAWAAASGAATAAWLHSPSLLACVCASLPARRTMRAA